MIVSFGRGAEMLLLASLCSIIVPLRSEREADATIPGPSTGFSPLIPLCASPLLADGSDAASFDLDECL